MARGRIISKTIPASKKMALLSCDSARLTYLYLYTQVDDEGRIEGDSFLIRSLLFPRDESKTKEDVERWLQEMHDVGLIIRYYDKSRGDWFIQIPDFDEYNWIRSDRFKKSKFPAPPKELLRNVLKEESGSEKDDRCLPECQPRDNQQSDKRQSQYNLIKSNISITKKRNKDYGIPKELCK